MTGGATRQLSVRFTPTREGAYESDFLIATSSPSVPTVMLRLVGEAYDPLSTRDAGMTNTDSGVARDATTPTADVMAGDDASNAKSDAGELLFEQQPDGCGCRTGGSSTRRGSGWALGLVALATLRRRRGKAQTR